MCRWMTHRMTSRHINGLGNMSHVMKDVLEWKVVGKHLYWHLTDYVL